MDITWKHSCHIDQRDAAETAAFTTLPIRIHKRNDIADAASRRLLKDWDYHMQDDQSQKSRTSVSSLGSMCALAFPEVLPERLAVLTYLADLGLMHGGEFWKQLELSKVTI
jgi:ophiobolin F synthase